MLQDTTSNKINPELGQLEHELELLNQKMEQLAFEGKYVLAEECKLVAADLKKDLDSKRKLNLKQNQTEEVKEVRKFLKEDLTDFDSEWSMRLGEQKTKASSLREALRKKQEKEREDQKARLEAGISSKGKESTQLINLRNAELNLAKLQNYTEAILVQKKIKEVLGKELKEWEKTKAEKVNTEMRLLNSKHLAETKVLEKKIGTECWELELERTKAKAKLVMKHSVIRRDLKTQNKKENLMATGLLKSRVDITSCNKSMISPSKQRILSSSRSQKLLSTLTDE